MFFDILLYILYSNKWRVRALHGVFLPIVHPAFVPWIASIVNMRILNHFGLYAQIVESKDNSIPLGWECPPPMDQGHLEWPQLQNMEFFCTPRMNSMEFDCMNCWPQFHDLTKCLICWDIDILPRGSKDSQACGDSQSNSCLQTLKANRLKHCGDRVSCT